MPIHPDELTVAALPRSPLPGGLKVDAVSDLLERAAEDYREALAQAKRLGESLAEQTRRIEQLQAEVDFLESGAAASTDVAELARSMLASAHRTARERKEEARRESELLLRKAERRAERIEQDARRRLEGGLSDLEQLDAFREELVGRLRSTLEAIVALDGRESRLGAT